LRVEGIGYDVGGHPEVHRGLVGTRVEFFMFYFFKISNQGSLGNMVGRSLGNIGKAPKKFLLRQQGAPKKTSWVLEILMF